MKLSDNNSENKKWQRILVAACVIIIFLGLGFLFWTVWNGCATGICGSGHSVANLYFIPAGIWNGFSPGTCGPDTIPMTYTSTIKPAFATSFLREFGESEPGPAPVLPPILQYPLRKEVIDSLMARAQVNSTEDSIIGLYEFPDSRLLLINQDIHLTEILETGEGIRTYTLVPEPVGNWRTGSNEAGPALKNAYTSSTEHVVTIQRIHLMLPPAGNETALLYIVNKTIIERVFSPDHGSLASITTRGTFYVRYGQRVERVISGSAVTVESPWTLCSQKIGISGEDSMTGELKQTVKLAWSSERMLRAYLVTSGAHIQVHDASGSSSSQWRSNDSTGCSC